MERSVIEKRIRAEAHRMWRLPTLVASHNGKALPEITLRHSHTKTYSSGVAYHNGRVVVTLGSDAVDRRVALLHELVHASLPIGTSHNNLFWSTFRSAAREAWPHVDFAFDLEPRHDKWHKHQWIIDRISMWMLVGRPTEC